MAKKTEQLELVPGVRIEPIKRNNPYTTNPTSFSKMVSYLDCPHCSRLARSKREKIVDMNSLVGLAEHDLANKIIIKQSRHPEMIIGIPELLGYIKEDWVKMIHEDKSKKELHKAFKTPILKDQILDKIIPSVARYFMAINILGARATSPESQIRYYLFSEEDILKNERSVPSFKVPIVGQIDHLIYQNHIPEVWDLKSNVSSKAKDFPIQLTTYALGALLRDLHLASRTAEVWEGYPLPKMFVYDMSSSQRIQVVLDNPNESIASFLTMFQWGYIAESYKHYPLVSSHQHLSRAGLNGLLPGFESASLKKEDAKVNILDQALSLEECFDLACSAKERFLSSVRVVKHEPIVPDRILNPILERYIM